MYLSLYYYIFILTIFACLFVYVMVLYTYTLLLILIESWLLLLLLLLLTYLWYRIYVISLWYKLDVPSLNDNNQLATDKAYYTHKTSAHAARWLWPVMSYKWYYRFTVLTRDLIWYLTRGFLRSLIILIFVRLI